jgi:hypothetical protein
MAVHRAIRRHANIGATCERRLLVECDRHGGAQTLVYRDGANGRPSRRSAPPVGQRYRLPLPPRGMRMLTLVESVREGPVTLCRGTCSGSWRPLQPRYGADVDGVALGNVCQRFAGCPALNASSRGMQTACRDKMAGPSLRPADGYFRNRRYSGQGAARGRGPPLRRPRDPPPKSVQTGSND